MMARPWVFGAPLLLLALAQAPSPAVAAEPLIGAPAPAFDLPTLDGDRVALADLRGQLVVLHFGAGW
ncbi:MAG TPA: hypothetical protein VMV46_18375 [Thermoanaerobaculia bacterium]|nr:hypothetical protein [Thermoanaerobaculia bacterium]